MGVCRRDRSGNRTSHGFTMLELLIACAIAAILLGIGVPALGDMLVNQRIRSAANELYSDLAFARAEAIKRNGPVQVVRAETGWADGWSVRAGGNTLRLRPRIGDITTDGASDSIITYQPDGRAAVAGTLSFNFTSLAGGAITMRCVVVTPSGRPAVRVDANRSGSCNDG